jgi:hypothetical protein
MAANTPPSPTTSHLPPIPSSPTYSYASTANPLSQYNLPPPPPPRPIHAVLTKADLDASQTAYADLLTTAKSYRLALAALSTAASAFGAALESCARLKEARADALGPPPGASMSNSFSTKQTACTADALLAASGLQHLVANHQHILSETVYRAFEVPLLHELDKWRGAVADEEESYEKGVAERSKEIRRLEREGVKMQRKGGRRDVAVFRGHLVELTGKLDGLTVLHGEHARTLLRESQETSVRIVEAGCSLVRAEVDIFESLARKGWSGGGLDDVLEKGVDLFAAEMDAVGGPGKGGGGDGVGVGGGDGTKLFSILPPKSILADASGTDTLRGGKNTRSDSLLMDGERYRSIAGAMSAEARDRDADSVFSELNRSRNVRPFSPQPQPLRLNPDDLLGSLENGADEPLLSSGREGGHGHDGGDGDEGCAVEDGQEDGNNDDEGTHMWRNEGLRRGTPSDDESQDKVGVSLGDPQREETWSVAESNA